MDAMVNNTGVAIDAPLRSNMRPDEEARNEIVAAVVAPVPLRLSQVSAELLEFPSKKKKRRPAKKVASPIAHTIIRGFTPVPRTMGTPDSTAPSMAVSPRLNSIGSTTASPLLRPSSSASMGGISALRLQMEASTLSRTSSRPNVIQGPGSDNISAGSRSPCSDEISRIGSDSEMTADLECYEVPIDVDFASQHSQKSTSLMLSTVEGGLVPGHPGVDLLRKMTAEDFEPLKCLGKGSFGTVLLVRHKLTGKLYAQKQFKKASLTVHKKLVEQTKTERAILESVNRHPFIVNLYYAFQDHEKLYLILEYAQGGELFTHLAEERMFSEEVAAFYMAELVIAVSHLHRQTGVMYRDLKPENVLLDERGHLLLTDFGLSKVSVQGDERCNSILGTVEYMAPEVVQGKDYGFEVDWWSLGALGHDLMTGSPPFSGNNHQKIKDNIVNKRLQLPYYLSADAKDLLTRLLRKEPHKRLGYNMPKDLQVVKQHRFFRKIDWKRLERREVEAPICPLITDPEMAENFSNDFTEMGFSPVRTRFDLADSRGADPFGGFSFVGPCSLVEAGAW